MEQGTKAVQGQNQKTKQRHRLTQQRMQVVTMIEMPLAELEQDVQMELDDNLALEVGRADESDFPMDTGDTQDSGADFSENKPVNDERQDELNKVLEDMGNDDTFPEPGGGYGGGYPTEESEETIWGDQTSFYDKMKEQMGEEDLDDRQSAILKYLIGSLDSDGLLRKSLDSISDELAFRENIIASEDEIEEVLQVLQGFDPAGIGARSLQECLLLQIRRRDKSPLRDQMERVVSDYFEELIHNHWQDIAQQMGLDEETMNVVKKKIRRLNPKPGASMSETEGRNLQQIVPDFVVDVSDDGVVTFELNKGHVPNLYVSESFIELMNSYRSNSQTMSRKDKEALVYAREKVERAQNYIEAIKLRRRTLFLTMKAIILLQKRYFLSGDENDLQPMVLKDVAEQTGLDISTISRVCNAKYAQTPYGTFRLRHFFSERVAMIDGQEVSNRQIRAALKELVDGEDKQRPLSDDALSKALAAKGFPIARRTVAKYRDYLHIPPARLRKH